ncbi:MAG: hypothetical protein ACFB0C_23440, partial [Leptolyngbyaceae cyanobacterium]
RLPTSFILSLLARTSIVRVRETLSYNPGTVKLDESPSRAGGLPLLINSRGSHLGVFLLCCFLSFDGAQRVIALHEATNLAGTDQVGDESGSLTRKDGLIHPEFEIGWF